MSEKEKKNNTPPMGNKGPNGAKIPEGMKIPDGVKIPEGMKIPDGADIPQGMKGPAGAKDPAGAGGPAGMRGSGGAGGPAGMRGPGGAGGPAGMRGPGGAGGPAGMRGPGGPGGMRGPMGMRRGPGGPMGGMRGGTGEKAMDFGGTWRKMLLYARKYWPLMGVAILCAIVGVILMLLGPDRLSEITDTITAGLLTGIDMAKIRRLCFTLVGFYGFSALMTFVQHQLLVTVSQGVGKSLRSDIDKKINRLPMWFYDHTATGDVLSRMTNDVDLVAQSMNQSVGTLVTAVTTLVAALIMMLTTSVLMTITAVVATMIGFVLMFVIMGHSQKYFMRQQRHLGEIDGHIEEIYTGHTIVKAYNGEEEARETFVEMNENLRSSAFRAQALSGLMMPIMTFIGNFGYVAVCVVGAALTMNGRITFGVIVAFMMYVRYFTQPLSQIAQSMQSLQSAAAAGERVFEFLEAEEMEDESAKTAKLPDVQGRVEFNHVRFGYEGTDRVIIHDFSMAAHPGQKIAIVGPTGAGKTTLVNLLMRFHEVNSGEIRIEGVPTKDLKREDVRAQFCMVLQDTWLFEGTLRENLLYGIDAPENGEETQADEEKMIRACKAVGMDHFIRTLPKGYDTVLNDQLNLSQGQQQQLTIARAMIADRPMLILDEATSSVDTRTEQKIQKAMDELMKGRTSFVIAHRLSTIRNADLILVLRDGDVVETGTHDELMAQNGFYAELYNSQFENN